jgi:hypothetical protein
MGSALLTAVQDNNGRYVNVHVLSVDGTLNQSYGFESEYEFAPIVSSAMLQNGPWLAVALARGQVNVIDVEHGKVIAEVNGQGESPEVRWLHDRNGASPLLVVATGTKLNAFRMKQNQLK